MRAQPDSPPGVATPEVPAAALRPLVRLATVVTGAEAAVVVVGGVEVRHGDSAGPATASVALVLPDGEDAGELRVHGGVADAVLTTAQRQCLRDLGGQVVALLEAQRRAVASDRDAGLGRESEARYRQLVEQTPDAILVHVDGVVAFANPAAAALLGATVAEELLGVPLSQLADPALAALHGDRIARVLAGDAVPLLRQRLRRLDGTWVDAEVSGARVEIDGRAGVQNVVRARRGPAGRDPGARGGHPRPGPGRGRAGAAARRARRRHRRPPRQRRRRDADRLEPRGRTAVRLVARRRSSPRTARSPSWSSTRSSGRSWAPLRAALVAARPAGPRAARTSSGCGTATAACSRSRGAGGPSPAPDGRVRLHGLLRDVGPRRRQEAELEAARDAALAASSAKTAFLANTSHEIRTPLNGVLGMTALLRDSDLSPEQREWADLAHRSGQGLLAVVDDVLDLAKIEAGRLDVAHRLFDLRRLLEDACAPLSAAAAAKGLALRLDRGGGPARARCRGDPDRLRQVLVNLLGNAVKFTPDGEVALTAEAGPGDRRLVRGQRHRARASRRPTRSALFEPFTQADASTTRRFGGTGLGLTISRDLVRVLGGELLVSSVGGFGSTFSFSLPMTDLGHDTAPLARDAASPAAARPLRLLLAEDSPVNQFVAVELLSREGCEVDVVDDGQQALDRLDGGHGYDALLLDCQMPVLDGYDTARALRAREAERGLARLPVSR